MLKVSSSFLCRKQKYPDRWWAKGLDLALNFLEKGGPCHSLHVKDLGLSPYMKRGVQGADALHHLRPLTEKSFL